MLETSSAEVIKAVEEISKCFIVLSIFSLRVIFHWFAYYKFIFPCVKVGSFLECYGAGL